MARIFPNSLANYDFQTRGEERVFSILKKLPDECRVWYEIVLGVRSRRPDFLVLDPNRGVIILEVKDWGKSTIKGVSKKEFKIQASQGRISLRKNPTRKCKIYIEEASELLELNDILTGKHDKLLFPVEHFVVFPNLSEEEFDELGLGRKDYIEREHTIFQKEVRNQTLFFKRFYDLIPELSEPLAPEMLLAIRNSLKDENTIDAPGGKSGLLPGLLPKGTIELADELAPDVFAIDIEQEELAKDMGKGPRLMRGIAGTGKTLIMLMRAKLLASNAEAQEKQMRILVLCWNVSLANYMRQAFDSINIPLNTKAHTNTFKSEGVPIIHFMEYARQLVRAHSEVGKFPRSKEDEFEEKVTQKLNSLNVTEHEKYDVIIIDEAQDFQDEWLKFLFHKMLKGDNPKEKNLILAADDAQRVYKSRTFTWAGLGIPMTGDRSRILRKIYRNSARVWGFAGFLLGDIRKFYDENPKLQFTPKRGVDPKLVKCITLDNQIDVCVKEIKNIGKSGYSWRNVLVIYKGKTFQGFPLIDKLMRALTKESIPFEWITENMNAKSTFRWWNDSVKISTALSAKGMDAPKVIILNAEAFSNTNTDYDEIKLMYVAMTRAREELTILHTSEGGIVPELQKCYNAYKKNRPHLIELEKKANDLVI